MVAMIWGTTVSSNASVIGQIGSPNSVIVTFALALPIVPARSVSPANSALTSATPLRLLEIGRPEGPLLVS